jgi:2-C-methyl-D-erythritol 4-phosphate cytidylyltransferase
LQVTDDTAACELIGQPVRLVESATPNPKITVPGDLAYLELLQLKNMATSVSTAKTRRAQINAGNKAI